MLLMFQVGIRLGSDSKLSIYQKGCHYGSKCVKCQLEATLGVNDLTNNRTKHTPKASCSGAQPKIVLFPLWILHRHYCIASYAQTGVTYPLKGT